MKVILAKHSGLCKGVERAIRLAFDAKKRPTYLLGNLAHNERVIEDLKKAGCIVIGEKDLPSVHGGSLVIRAHGVSPSLLEKIRETKADIIDATCPNVKKIHDLVEDYSSRGYSIIIIGDPKHPEVIGTMGYCRDVCVLDSLQTAEKTVFDTEKRYLLVCQTTFSEKISVNIIIYIKNKIKSLVIEKTICYTTKERQREAESLSRTCDAVLVVGSKSSSNTTKLFDICKENCDRVYLIESVSDLQDIDFSKIQKIAVTAGASTPRELIMEVLLGMSSENDVTLLNQENETAETTSATAAATEPTVQAEAKPAKIMTMDDVMASTRFEIREGMRVKVTVIRSDETGVYVSGLGKKDGFIAADRVTDGEYKPEEYPVGMTFSAIVVPNTNNAMKDYIALDKRKFDEIEEIDRALLDGVFELKIDKAVAKGGLLGKKGSYTVFIPASHIELHRVEDADLPSYVGKKLMVKKLPDKKGEEGESNKRHRIVASHKEVLIAEKKAAREKAEKEWQEKKAREEAEKKAIFEANRDRFEVNNVVPGVVKRFAEFGAFVNVYGFDCLAPKGELSWTKDKAPNEVLELGKEYEFVIIKVDAENYKVSLSYKLLQKRPYEIAQEKYPVGTIVKGKVQTIVNFGAFISIEPGVDGLVHVSNICDRKIASPADVLKVGDEVEAKVISFVDNRMALSIKDVNAPAEGEGQEAAPERKRTSGRPVGERKGKKPQNDEVSKEEQDIVANYGATESVSNNVFGDLLKNYLDDENKK